VRSEGPVAIGGLIEAAAARLRASGVTKPRREAHRLWAWVSRTSPGEAYLSRERGTGEALAQEFERTVARRVAGEPLAYVLGSAGFRHLTLRSDRRALIPRPETEGLVELALQRARTGRAVDLGTGSGCIALALAQEGRFDEVVAVDSSAEALALAGENAALTGLRIRLVESDLGAALGGERFDLLVANPPYLTDREYDALDPSVKAWEPWAALASGADGLDATRRILDEGRSLVVPEGWLGMELDSTRSEAAADLARTLGWREIGVHDDLFGRPRYLVARREHEA
jgi:release factor glutamine methyltransferase